MTLCKLRLLHDWTPWEVYQAFEVDRTDYKTDALQARFKVVVQRRKCLLCGYVQINSQRIKL